ncbi:hypothetical protein H5410_001607 [Solanum commersonii]|uniref:Uncharacterized protein n=1 Tax=Solanum commersonii TaxID=4109 RepID=A0A9J6B026_SOLCO|nr:hypothetical protein H5410_001607 [Solanum commersonii]
MEGSTNKLERIGSNDGVYPSPYMKIYMYLLSYQEFNLYSPEGSRFDFWAGRKGEATITLEDMFICRGFFILSNSVLCPP